ncbi:hypothetical protein Leryth_004301 [Lithospermum erythrorhizon]|nr:hypothetical protein Leryth_004301 [Lithospermum erythrorhizon]
MTICPGLLRGLLRSETASYASLRSIRLYTVATDSKPRRITKSRHVSPKTQSFLGGVSENPRKKANKKFWAYIKNQIRQVLMDRNVQKMIICDEKLKKLPLVQGIISILR